MSAQQEFGFKYYLDSSFNKVGQLYEYVETDSLVRKITGYVDMGKDSYPIYTQVKYIKRIPIKLNRDLLCRIELNETRDTLTIKPWPPKDSVNTIFLDSVGQKSVSLNEDSEYKLPITKWDITKCGYNFIKPSFSFNQFTATSIPFRANFKTGNIQAEFLNVNLSYFRVWGHTRIYQSDFVKSKNVTGGLGGYIGASTAGEETSKTFGLNYGLNGFFGIYGFNIVLALGAESAFDSRDNRFNPYFGFGVGFKLVEFFDAKAEKGE